MFSHFINKEKVGSELADYLLKAASLLTEIAETRGFAQQDMIGFSAFDIWPVTKNLVGTTFKY